MKFTALFVYDCYETIHGCICCVVVCCIYATARGLCVLIQQVEFVFFIKLYWKILDFCAPVIKTMQKPTLDAVQLSSMLDDFKNSLLQLDFNQIWEDSIKIDPEMRSIRRREGWRGIENSINGSPDSWK